MKIPSLRSEYTPISKIKADAISMFLLEDEKLFRRTISRLKERMPSTAPTLDACSFAGKESESLILYPAELKKRKLILVGLGLSTKLSTERLRRAAALAAKTARGLKATTLALIEPNLSEVEASFKCDMDEIAAALAEGSLLSLYKFDKYVTENSKKNTTLKHVSVVTEDPQRLAPMRKGTTRARIICEATYFARDLANAPANEIYPASLAQRAKESARKNGFTLNILDEKRIKALKMGGLLGVAQGSDKPPRFLVMEYRGRNSGKRPVVLVGKGVTFDAGGISIKPASGMGDMKMDMSGAAAVLGTMQAVSRLKLPVHLVGLVPATENLLGGSAMKPGDVLIHFNGNTSEVDNTDAEGRLILADALSYASRYKPELVIDLATLTGAVVVALGHQATGMMGNDDAAMTQLKEAGTRTYERVWQLPLFEEYEKLIKSEIADVKNVGGRWGGAITAALFLKKFIGDYKWIHLDIAGTAMTDESLDYIPRGGSGVGVRLLVDFLSHRRSK